MVSVRLSMGPDVSAAVLGMVPVQNDPPAPNFKAINKCFWCGFCAVLVQVFDSIKSGYRSVTSNLIFIGFRAKCYAKTVANKNHYIANLVRYAQGEYF